MKERSPYEGIAEMWCRAKVEGPGALTDAKLVLAADGIRLRQDDSILSQINLSKPTSKHDVLILGLRYVKEDGSQTEDHFMFDREKPSVIGKFYRRRLEATIAEYRGTHKQQVDLTAADKLTGAPTLVNTITFNIPGDVAGS